MIDITTLSREEQLQLLEDLWNRLSLTPEAIPLTDAQREELDRRLGEIDREGPVGIPADEVLSRLHTRRALRLTPRYACLNNRPIISDWRCK